MSYLILVDINFIIIFKHTALRRLQLLVVKFHIFMSERNGQTELLVKATLGSTIISLILTIETFYIFQIDIHSALNYSISIYIDSVLYG